MQHNEFKFTEIEFLEVIKNSKSHVEAAKKLGYSLKNSGTHIIKGRTKYGRFFSKLQPDISHFNLSSRATLKYANKLESSFKGLLRDAKERNKECTIIFENYEKIVQQQCYYCGCDGDSKATGYNNLKNKFVICGIDRVNNKIGYIKENCVPCCKKCNKMKHTNDKDEWLAHIQKIAQYQNSFRENPVLEEYIYEESNASWLS